MTKLVTGTAVLIGVGMMAPVARAQMALAPGVSATAGDQHVKTGVGVSLQAGGGFTSFTDTSARDVTNIGGYWDVRAVVGTRSFVAVELAYVGTARGLDNTTAFGSGVSLIGNGGEADFRLQLPFASSAGALVEPFIFGGFGWSTYRFSNLDIAVTSDSDTVGTVPFGGGIVVGYRGFMADARFTYRPTFGGTDVFFGDSANSGGLQSWTAGLMLGYEF